MQKRIRLKCSKCKKGWALEIPDKFLEPGVEFYRKIIKVCPECGLKNASKTKRAKNEGIL